MRAIRRFAPLALLALAASLATAPAPPPAAAAPIAPQASPARQDPAPMPGCVMHVDEWGRCTGISCPWGDFQC